MFGYQKKKLQSILNGKKVQFEERANVRTRHGRDTGISDQEFKTIMINMLTTLMDKVDKMQEQMGNESREMEVLRKNQK